MTRVGGKRKGRATVRGISSPLVHPFKLRFDKALRMRVSSGLSAEVGETLDTELHSSTIRETIRESDALYEIGAVYK